MSVSWSRKIKSAEERVPEDMILLNKVSSALELLEGTALYETLLTFSFPSHDLSPRQRSQPSSKVKKIFGDDVPSPTSIHKPLTAAQTPDTAWFLKHDLEVDLAYDVKGQVKGGTLDALIERLTRHDMMDSTFNQTFLLTFKSFTTHEEFFDKLIGRYYSQINLFNVDSIFPLHQDLQNKKSKSGKKKFNVAPN